MPPPSVRLHSANRVRTPDPWRPTQTRELQPVQSSTFNWASWQPVQHKQTATSAAGTAAVHSATSTLLGEMTASGSAPWIASRAAVHQQQLIWHNRVPRWPQTELHNTPISRAVQLQVTAQTHLQRLSHSQLRNNLCLPQKGQLCMANIRTIRLPANFQPLDAVCNQRRGTPSTAAPVNVPQSRQKQANDNNCPRQCNAGADP